MKKTIVAAAIAAVVSAPAFADMKISGQINQEFYTEDGGDLESDRNTDIVISGSEDLGNGLTASFKQVLTGDNGTNNGTQDVALGIGSASIVGLSGSFGSITMGKQEMFIESHAAAMAANDASDFVTNEVTNGRGTSDNGTIQYMSPSFNGLKVTAAMQAEGENDQDSFGIEYSNGALLVRAATASEGTNDSDVIGVQYKMGDLTAKVVNADENGSDETWYGVSYKMGNNTLAISTRDSDTPANEDTILSVKHNLSKNVAVYAVMTDDGAANSDVALVGMQVKF